MSYKTKKSHQYLRKPDEAPEGGWGYLIILGLVICLVNKSIIFLNQLKIKLNNFCRLAHLACYHV